MIDGKSFNTEAFKEESLDREIEKLVHLINQVDGVETTDSCFGHHKMPCRIWLRIKDVNTVNKFIRRFFYFDSLWSLKLTFSEASYSNELLFVIESAYQDYPTVDLMVENLTKRFEERVHEQKVRDKEGINNNDFFLCLFDTGLRGINPRDPNLTTPMKLRVMNECRRNFWYFLREVVRIPDQGEEV